MRSLTPAQYNRVLELLDKRLSGHAISTTTGISVGSISGIFSKHWSSISKATGGRPHKLSPTDTQYTIRLITSQKADNATDATKTLQNMTNTSFTVKTVCRALCGVAMKAVTKRKWPYLSKKHRRMRMDYAEAHQHWTVDDWKGVV